MGTRGRPRHAPVAEVPSGDRAARGRAERRRTAKRAKQRRRRSLAREVPLVVVVALGITLLLQTFLVQVFSIPSSSMEQTIMTGDRVAVDKLSPWFGWQPQRGDVVVFKDPDNWLKDDALPKDGPVLAAVKRTFTFLGLLPSDRDLIKRVIGLPGDTVACCDTQGRVTVNDRPLDESYVYPGEKPSLIAFKVTVPAGKLWVMGDHRDVSADSRFHMREASQGFVPESDVVGRAVAVVWPVGRWRALHSDPALSVSAAGVVARAGPGSAAGSGRGAAQQSVRQFSPAAGTEPVPSELPLVMGVAATVPRSRLRRKSRRHPPC
ncbi:signal peptidase I [Streptacidiphilus monticola]|uniref:Signal peptidase I n=1 Tax=Streptacidiphilus monticola TaxID=2161674 RepID=A0ABW1FZR2_9ACTN